MNSPALKVLSIFCSAILFTALLYKQHIGLNLLLFELIIIGLLMLGKRITLDNEVLLTVGGTLITGIMVVVHNSVLAITVNFMSLFLMTGVLLSPSLRSLVHSTLMGLKHLALAQFEFFVQFIRLGASNSRLGTSFRWLRIVAIPLLVVLIFMAIYSAANPVFDGMLSKITHRLDILLIKLAEWIEFGVFWFFIFGMLICDFLLLRTTQRSIEKSALSSKNNLLRTRNKVYSKKLRLGLKYELRSGVLLLAILNLLILLINCIDIYWVWFNFEWDGDYLKQFVHEGTSLLIISILISIGISLYLFRGNQNFYSQSGILKKLALLWLGQNALLAVSVCVRNLHYIEYYALAHKRIGVFFFLLATLIGLVLVIIKIWNKKTLHFVTRTNAISVYSILIIMTLVNWDVVITNYNFKHYQTSFTHFDFLWNLSYSTLPYQQRSSDFLKKVEASNEKFPSKEKYLPAWEYELRVKKRRKEFEEDWEECDWRSWNWAYHRAYSQLQN